MTTSPQIQAARDALAAHDNHTPLTGADGFSLIGSVERGEYVIAQIRPAIIGAETLLEQIANLIAGTKTGDVYDNDAVESIESLLYVFGVPIPERYTDDDMTDRLEELRVELRAERISYGELAELQGLARFIDPSDTELLEAAGVPEGE